MRAASRRECAPSLEKTFETWRPAVPCEMTSRSAMARLESPVHHQAEHLELARGQPPAPGPCDSGRAPAEAAQEPLAAPAPALGLHRPEAHQRGGGEIGGLIRVVGTQGRVGARDPHPGALPEAPVTLHGAGRILDGRAPAGPASGELGQRPRVVGPWARAERRQLGAPAGGLVGVAERVGDLDGGHGQERRERERPLLGRAPSGRRAAPAPRGRAPGSPSASSARARPTRTMRL